MHTVPHQTTQLVISFLCQFPGSADYNETSVLLHFAPENATELHCVTVPILEDSVLEESETFGVLLTSPEEVVTLLPQMTIVTIHDNDGNGESLKPHSSH